MKEGALASHQAVEQGLYIRIFKNIKHPLIFMKIETISNSHTHNHCFELKSDQNMYLQRSLCILGQRYNNISQEADPLMRFVLLVGEHGLLGCERCTHSEG